MKGRVSTNRSSKSGYKTSTGGAKEGAGAKVHDKPVKWPQPGPSRGEQYNHATKMPVIKTSVVGTNFD